jgi:flavin-dependent dehydrogenase
MLLAQKGYRVLLLDRAHFPSDMMSTLVIWHPGVAQLKKWGFLKWVQDSGCPPLRLVRFDVGDFAITGSPPPLGDVADAFAPRRTVLDKILVDAAVEAGAEFRESFSVQEIIFDGSKVTGIRGRGKNGAAVAEAAQIVVGADGPNSLVARTVNSPTYNEKPATACYYYSFWSGVPLLIEGQELYPREGRIIGAWPTNGGLTLIVVGWRREEFTNFRENVERNFLETLRQFAPGLAGRVEKGNREERFVGTAGIPNFFRKPYGPGWALVGDAGYHKDPVTAQGISDAFQHAELLAEAIDDDLSKRKSHQVAFGDYEQRRNDDVIHRYELTCDLATLAAPPPEMLKLFDALRHNQREADRYFGAVFGTLPIPEFFSAENLQRIIRAGQ